MIIQFQFEFSEKEPERKIMIQVPKDIRNNSHIYNAIKELLIPDLNELHFKFNQRIDKLRKENKL